MLFKYYTANVITTTDSGATCVVGMRVWRTYRWWSPVYAVEQMVDRLSADQMIVDVRRIK